jgi:hypothetical protein
MDAYKQATTAAEATSSRDQVGMYTVILGASAVVGVAGLGLFPVSMFLGPDQKKLEANIKSLNDQLRELGKSQK